MRNFEKDFIVKRDKTSSHEFHVRIQHEKVVKQKIGGNGKASFLSRPRKKNTHTYTKRKKERNKGGAKYRNSESRLTMYTTLTWCHNRNNSIKMNLKKNTKRRI